MNKLELLMRLNVAEKELEDFIKNIESQPNQDEVMSAEDQKKCTELLNNIEGLIKLM